MDNETNLKQVEKLFGNILNDIAIDITKDGHTKVIVRSDGNKHRGVIIKDYKLKTLLDQFLKETFKVLNEKELAIDVSVPISLYYTVNNINTLLLKQGN